MGHGPEGGSGPGGAWAGRGFATTFGAGGRFVFGRFLPPGGKGLATLSGRLTPGCLQGVQGPTVAGADGRTPPCLPAGSAPAGPLACVLVPAGSWLEMAAQPGPHQCMETRPGPPCQGPVQGRQPSKWGLPPKQGPGGEGCQGHTRLQPPTQAPAPPPQKKGIISGSLRRRTAVLQAVELFFDTT